MRAGILAVVAVAITLGVYGVVGLIVKMDDVGLHLAERSDRGSQAVGRGLVRAMPKVMAALSAIGIAAMIWVGGGIIVHGLEAFGVTAPAHLIHDAAEAAGHVLLPLAGLVEWLTGAAGSGLLGLAIGGVLVLLHHLFAHRKSRTDRATSESESNVPRP
jgi:predicted DNA repair protein MutK